jgi:hypothetical protein
MANEVSRYCNNPKNIRQPSCRPNIRQREQQKTIPPWFYPTKPKNRRIPVKP